MPVTSPKGTAESGKSAGRVALFTMGYNGKYHPLTGYHPKQPQAQKLIQAAKLAGVPSWSRQGVLQGIKAGETRSIGHRNINIKEAETLRPTFILPSSVPGSEPSSTLTSQTIRVLSFMSQHLTSAPSTNAREMTKTMEKWLWQRLCEQKSPGLSPLSHYL